MGINEIENCIFATMKLKHLLLVLLFSSSATLHSQTVDYYLVNELPKVRTEKIEPDGSVWYSYVKQDTFYLDSITPSGQVFQKYSLDVDTIGQYNNYLYHPTKGIIITRSIDSTQNCWYCKSALTIFYDFQGNKIWDDNQYPITNTEGIRFRPIIHHDSLIIDVTYDTGDGNTFDVYLFYDWNGNNISTQWMKECITNVTEQYNWLWQISSRVACFYGGNNTHPGPDRLFRYDTNFINPQGTYWYKSFKTPNYYPNNTSIIGSKIQIIDSSHFCGIAYPEGESDYPINCFITLENDSFQWDSLGFNTNHKILDTQKHANGYLFLTAKTDPSTIYDGTIIKLFWYNPISRSTSEVWSTIILGNLKHGEIETLGSGNQIEIFINIFKSDSYPTVEPTNSETEDYYNIKLTFNDIISTVKEKATTPRFSYYPNPSSNYIILQVSNQGELRVFNITGSLISKTNYPKGEHTLDISQYKNGTYLLNWIDATGNSFTDKLLIAY